MLVHDDNKPRGFWRLVCVKSLICGNDGHSRGAVLTTTSPGEKRITLRQPLQRLYTLKVRNVSLDCSENENEPDGLSEIPTTDEVVDRPKRAAAIKARDQCKAIALHEQEDETLD